MDLAQELVRRILVPAQDYFARYTEDQMPPKARAALLATILEWNMQTAATLEFVSFENQLTLAYFYIHPQRFHRLDIRTSDEKNKALTEFLTSTSVSETAKEMVNFLTKYGSFSQMQELLLRIVRIYEEHYHNTPFLWQTPQLRSIEIPMQLANAVHSFNLLNLLPGDIEHMFTLIGGYIPFNEQQAKTILRIIDQRLQKKGGAIDEILHILRLHYDYPALRNDERKKYWELELTKKGSSGEAKLLELRKLLDFYAYRDLKEARSLWTDKFIEHLKNNPSFNNFYDILVWITTQRACFQQGLEEYASTCKPATYLGYQICKGFLALQEEIGLARPLIQDLNKIRSDLEKQLGLDIYDNLDLKEELLMHPAQLVPLFSRTDGALHIAGKMIKTISELFFNKIRPLVLQKVMFKVQGGDPDAEYTYGHWLYKDGKYTDAFSFLEDAADQGHARAQYLLGLMCLRGQGTDASPEKAPQWLQKAAEQELMLAQRELALLYDSGTQVAESPSDALKWYKRAAQNGDEFSKKIIQNWDERNAKIEKRKAILEKQQDM